MACRHYQKGGTNFCAICSGEQIRRYGTALTRIANYEIVRFCGSCVSMQEIAQDALSDRPARAVSCVADPAWYF